MGTLSFLIGRERDRNKREVLVESNKNIKKVKKLIFDKQGFKIN